MIRFFRLLGLLAFALSALSAMGCMAGQHRRRIVVVHAAPLPTPRRLSPPPRPRPARQPPSRPLPAPATALVAPAGYTSSTVAVTSRSGSKIARCLGVMVAPRVAITAGHCVVGRTETMVRPSSPSNAQDAISVTSFWFDPNADTSDGNVDMDDSDVAILVLERPLAMPAYASYARSPQKRPVRAIAARHVGERLEPMGITLRRSPRSRYYVSEGFGAPGDSGSPVFVRTEDGDLVVVAVLAGGSPGREVLARVDVMSNKLDELVTSTAAPSPKTAAR